MKVLIRFSVFLLLLSAGVAAGQVIIDEPPYFNYINYGGYNDLALFVLPDGSGSPFTEAQIMNDGTIIDASLEVILRDDFGDPIPNYPREDMWLEADGSGLSICVGGTCPDADTDEFGRTTWTNSPHAGGHSLDVMHLVVAGLPQTAAPLTLFFNSADINADGTVNILDVVLFSEDYFGDYSFRSDFHADGVLNVLDVGRLAEGIAATCE